MQDKDGVIDLDEFKQAFGWEDSEVASRFFHVFDLNGDQTIDFSEFVLGLATCRSGTEEERTRFLFRMYDLDGDGCIVKDELMAILRASILENFSVNLTEKQMRAVVEHTFSLVDVEKKGSISYDQFAKLTRENPSLLNALRFEIDVSH